MTDIMVNGAMGHMGEILCRMIDEAEDLRLAARVDVNGDGKKVLKSPADHEGKVDILIDFSHHTAAPGLIKWARETKTAVMICTTAHTPEEKAIILGAASEIPVFYSANMSMGIALLVKMAKKAAEVFPDADIEIVERHHNRKLDAPSGTALMLAEAVRDSRGGGNIVCGRSGMAKREPGDIGVSSLRMGNLAGCHEVIFTTATQSLTLGHEVYDRALFAEGALSAARYMDGKPAGHYDMESILAE